MDAVEEFPILSGAEAESYAYSYVRRLSDLYVTPPYGEPRLARGAPFGIARNPSTR